MAIDYQKEGKIATFTINRPQAMNSMNVASTQELHEAMVDFRDDPEAWVGIITGAGEKAFCAGADIKDMLPFMKEHRDSPWAIPATPLRGLELWKPLIAAINGLTLGGGLEIALACDIRIASDRARFAEVYIRRGIIPVGGGTYYLPRLVGTDKACLLIWTGDMIDAKEAERMGLVTMVVPHEELESATWELAEKLVKGPPLAIKKAKSAIYEGLEMDIESTLDYVAPIIKELHDTEDHKEGAQAFVEKREPFFKGR